MSTLRQRALSTRSSGDVYVAWTERVQAEECTISTLVAQLLEQAPGGSEVVPEAPPDGRHDGAAGLLQERKERERAGVGTIGGLEAKVTDIADQIERLHGLAATDLVPR